MKLQGIFVVCPCEPPRGYFLSQLLYVFLTSHLPSTFKFERGNPNIYITFWKGLDIAWIVFSHFTHNVLKYRVYQQHPPCIHRLSFSTRNNGFILGKE